MEWMLGIVVVLAGILGLLFQRFEAYRPFIVFFGTAVGIGATVLVALFTFRQFVQIAESYEQSAEHHLEEVEQNRKFVAFSYIEKWRAFEKPEVRNFFVDLQQQAAEEHFRYVAKDPKRSQIAQSVLNFFEDVALAAERQYADEQTLCAFFQTIAQRGYSALEPVVKAKRSENPEAWTGFEKMLTDWSGGCEGGRGEGEPLPSAE